MEIRPVRRDEAALRELRLRSLESEDRLPLSYWEEWAHPGSRQSNGMSGLAGVVGC
jgi:hypothetical protein